MSDQGLTLLILAATILVFVWNRLPAGIVALGVALSLWATGVLTLDEVLSGFGSPTVILIAALFVVAEALDAAGITTWVGQKIIDHSGDSRSRMICLLLGAVAILSALITPNGAAAALIPIVVILAVRRNESPSMLLMPVAFAAHAGALLVLTGSPVTLLVSEAIEKETGSGLAFFEVAWAGVPIFIGTLLIALFLGRRLLPDRKPKSMIRDLSSLPDILSRQYIHEDELARFTVTPGSSLIGTLSSKVDFGVDSHVHVLSVQDMSKRPRESEPVVAGDSLVVRGTPEGIADIAHLYDLETTDQPGSNQVSSGLINKVSGVAEVIISPRSHYLGDRVFPGMITDSGELVVLAVQRHGEDLGNEETILKAGDSLLLQGRWDVLDEHTLDPNVILVDSPDAIRRQTVPLGPRTVPALAVLVAMVALLVSGVVPAAVACLGAAMAMVLLRVVSVDHAHRSISLTTLILVAGMMPLSDAISTSGAAETLATYIVDAVGGGSPYFVLAALFLITALLGQMISNTATALILIPIAVTLAPEMAISPITLLMCVNVAAAASLLTPIATPANLMVMSPAGYQFGDYWKFGLPVMGVYALVSIFLVPVIWPF